MKVQTQSVHFTADAKLISFIEKKLNKLDQFFDRIVSANVTLKLENSGQIKDKVAEIQLNVPGAELYVKETTKTFEASVDSGVASLKRQIMKHKERSRMKS